MKKINFKILAFILFIGTFFAGFDFKNTATVFYDFAYQYFSSAKEAVSERSLSLLVDGFDSLKFNVETFLDDHFRLKNACLDVNSALYNVTARREFVKGEEVYYLSYKNSILVPSSVATTEDIEKHTNELYSLYSAAKAEGAEFLYVAVPGKGYGFSRPSVYGKAQEINHDGYVKAFTEKGIPCLDLAVSMRQAGLGEDAYFLTDHHWKPETGFWATGEILKTLGEKYGFNYNKDYCDINNFSVKTYKNHFLGSYGKKIGRFFSPSGYDDISVISPAFETSLVETNAITGDERRGTFEETVLHTERFDDDVYKFNHYGVYSGADFRNQIVENLLNTGGKKILIVRDSYAMVVTPFLALNASELHIIDVRTSFIFDEEINVKDYVKENRPDYVLVLYSGFDDDRFNFGD